MIRAGWKEFRGSHKEPDHIMLSINGDAETSMAVTWRTSTDIDSGYALCRRVGDTEWKRTDAQTGVFNSDIDESHIFWANMKNLLPDTHYEYTVGNDDFRSEIYDFCTAPENLDDFEFICFADIQTGEPDPPADYSEFNEVLRAAIKKHPNVRFILTAGDNTNCGQTDVQWTGVLEGFKGVMEHIPLMMAIGNHDDMVFDDYFTFKGKHHTDKVEFFCDQFRGAYPFNGPEKWETVNYAFDYGNAHFNMTGLSNVDEINDWLLEEIPQSDKTWKFGTHHFPICYCGSDLACEDSYPMMMQGLEQCDVIFSGHEHCFSRSFPRRNENLYDNPSEGTVFYNLASGNRNPPGTLPMPKLWNAAWYAHDEKLSMYAIAHVSGGKLTLTSYVEDGRIVDRCVIDKDSDCIEPIALAPVFRNCRMMFKGADLGLCVRETPCEKVDGVWMAPAAILFRYAGFGAELGEGTVSVEAYSHKATFTLGSNIAKTDKGNIEMSHEVIKHHRDQLYVPVDGFEKAFEIRCSYFERNNILSFEHISQEKPVPKQKNC